MDQQGHSLTSHCHFVLCLSVIPGSAGKCPRRRSIGQQLRKLLGSSDNAVNIVPPVLPFLPAVGLEVVEFHPVELLVANPREGKAGLDEVARGQS